MAARKEWITNNADELHAFYGNLPPYKEYANLTRKVHLKGDQTELLNIAQDIVASKRPSAVLKQLTALLGDYSDRKSTGMRLHGIF